MSPWQNAFHCGPPTRPLPAGAVMALKGVDEIRESPVLWYGLEVREIIIWHLCDSSQILLLKNCLPHTAGEALRPPCYIRLKWRMQHKSPEPWPWLWLNAHTGPFPWGMSWLEPINPVLSALSLTLRTWESAHWSHFRISGVKMKISRVPTVFGKHYHLISVVKANKYPSSWMWFAVQRSCTLLMSVLLCA